jgi:hypothetical protein
MKRCPKCDFSFADFHHVCDFDGTNLVDDPGTLPVSPGVSALVPATQSPFLRLIKSPVFFAVLGLAGVLSSALLIGYYDATSRPNSIAESPAPRDSPDSPDSIASQVPPTQPPAQPPARIRTRIPSNSPNEVSTGSGSDRVTSRSEISKPAKDLSSTREPSVTASRPRARLHQSPIRNQQSRPETGLQRQTKDKVLRKESKESALQRDSKENANRKEPKLTAALKTTWNIIKKPFKF